MDVASDLSYLGKNLENLPSSLRNVMAEAAALITKTYILESLASDLKDEFIGVKNDDEHKRAVKAFVQAKMKDFMDQGLFPPLPDLHDHIKIVEDGDPTRMVVEFSEELKKHLKELGLHP
jgi:hypothetical protein